MLYISWRPTRQKWAGSRPRTNRANALQLNDGAFVIVVTSNCQPLGEGGKRRGYVWACIGSEGKRRAVRDVYQFKNKMRRISRGKQARTHASYDREGKTPRPGGRTGCRRNNKISEQSSQRDHEQPVDRHEESEETANWKKEATHTERRADGKRRTLFIFLAFCPAP